MITSSDIIKGWPKRLLGWILQNRIWTAILIIGCLLLLAWPFFLSNSKLQSVGQVGDFVGGYYGTILTLISIGVLILTLRDQNNSTKILNFEAKYFEMLRLHRENVSEIGIGDARGRKIFVILIREFREILEKVRQINGANQTQYSLRQLVNISYYCLFYGVGPNSSRMLQEALSKYDREFVADLIENLDTEANKDAAVNGRKFNHRPFEGHQSRLGHYYRHLYQSVKYVDRQAINIDKYEYVKTIRAQLSNHEQALLLLNSLTPVGAGWWDNGFMLNYRMAKNLPKSFFDTITELKLDGLFPKGYFEWENQRSEEVLED